MRVAAGASAPATAGSRLVAWGLVVAASLLVPAHAAHASAMTAAAPPEFADSERVALSYDAYFGPLRLLSVATSSVVNENDYAMQVTMRTEGIVRLLFPWTAVSTSQGVVRSSRLCPVHHRIDSNYRGASSRIDLRYREDGHVELTAEPSPSEPPREEVAPALQRETVDPLTATIALVRANAAGEPCNETWHIFDGRARYDLRFADLGQTIVEPARGARYHGPAHLCEATVDPIAGFLESNDEDRDKPSKLRYWLAPVLAGVRPMPVLLELSGARGALQIYLTDARAGDAAPGIALR